MHLRLFVVLLASVTAPAQPRAMSPFWVGLWEENPSKTSVFFPGTLSVAALPGGTYLLIGPSGEKTFLDCASELQPSQPCLHLTAPEPSKKRSRQTGFEYKLNALGTELQVDRWRIVPDGERLTDTDLYVRSTSGTGFAGSWRKISSTEAPTTYRISVHQARMTIAIPNGELRIEFSLSKAASRQGAYVSFGPGRGNRYKILGAYQLLEQSLRQGKVVARGVITISADGCTMTEDHTDVGPQAYPLHMVYDRR